ncbi:hypothetical protein ACH4TQ_30735 [Streptomyces sp. NPDC021218]|uniref:hypothetical protein n=1 Tax=Streptomyces sp. NPDC021218 TaxID=3365119 RepID=UPI0037967813
MSADALATLLPEQGIDSMIADEQWNAVGVVDWGRHVLDALGDRTGAVFEDPVLRHLTWIIPPGAADAWPVAPPVKETLFEALRITLYQAGDNITVPGLTGSRGGDRWIHPPTEDRLFTDAGALRHAIESIAGPLDEAAEKSPVRVCRFCCGTTRDAIRIDMREFSNGLMSISYTCKPCWHDTGGSDAHLLGSKGPQ